VRPDDSKAKPRDEETASDGPAAPPGLSQALAADLTAHRTAALRAVLSERPDIGLALMVHALAQAVFYDEGDESGIAVQADTPALRAEGLEDGEAVKRLMRQRDNLVTDLPEQPEALWDWLLARDTNTLLALLAHCVACTVKPERGIAADRLAAAVKLDMKDWWQPSGSYFGRVPKALILGAVTEGAGRAAADNIATLKKSDMADRAAELLTGTGWLPALLRAA
jgi:ParB family chromosome partitioning protein